MYRLIRQLDSKAVRGGMQRCYLYSKKIVWICSDHQKFSRGFLADDDLDSEDVTLNMDETDNAKPATFNDNNILSLEAARTVDDLAQSPSSEPAPIDVTHCFLFSYSGHIL